MIFISKGNNIQSATEDRLYGFQFIFLFLFLLNVTWNMAGTMAECL